VSVSAKLVLRFGYRVPLAGGLALATVGLLLLARAPADGQFVIDVLPSMLLLGLGAGIAFNPVLLAAMGDVDPQDSGLASGLVNTSFMMGGALGLAVLASLAAARSGTHVDPTSAAALLDGYHLAFLAGGLLAAVAAVLGWVGIRDQELSAEDEAWDGSTEPELAGC
jgi:MFS family permease